MGTVMPRSSYRRPSLSGPLILIAIGIIFLLNNLGVLSGNFWDVLIRFWPVLLMIFGLDSIYRGEGLFGSIFITGLGAVFLLMNLGTLSGSAWDILFQFWPVFIILVGVDVILSRTRHNVWVSIAGLVLALILIIGIIWFANSTYNGPKNIKTQTVEVPLEQGVTEAVLNISTATGEVKIHAADRAGSLLTGEINLERMETIQQNQVHQESTDLITIRSKGLAVTPTFGGVNRNVWDLGFSPAVNLTMDLSLAAGACDINLGDLNVSELHLSMGVGKCTVALPSTSGFVGQISGGIGDMTVVVPRDLPVRIHLGNALTGLNYPAEFIRDGNTVTYSPDGSTNNPLELETGIAIGNLSIRLAP